MSATVVQDIVITALGPKVVAYHFFNAERIRLADKQTIQTIDLRFG